MNGIVDRLAAKAMQSMNVRDKLAALGVVPMLMTPEQFDAHIKDEVVTNAGLVRAAGIRAE
jgi:tripartite-type tricarboxylate transporter receptor subunit TctC